MKPIESVNPYDNQALCEVVYPAMKVAVLQQLDRSALEVESGLDTEGSPCLYIRDHKKVIVVPVRTPSLVNVSHLVDTAELKAYFLSDHDKAN